MLCSVGVILSTLRVLLVGALVKPGTYLNECSCPRPQNPNEEGYDPRIPQCKRKILPARCQCRRAEKVYVFDQKETCLQWQINPPKPLKYSIRLQPLKKAYIQGLNSQDHIQPSMLSHGYCPLRPALALQTVHLGYIAGLPANSTVEHVYAHPHFGLVGVNTTTHAHARFGKEGHYQNNYQQYVPECHCFERIEATTSNGWIRVLDDWTLWMGVSTRGRLGIPHKYLWQYSETGQKDAYGWPLVRLKTPRPPEKLMFQRHLDFRVVTLVNLTKLYPQGLKDFSWEEHQYLYSLSSRRATDPNEHPLARWRQMGQRHGTGAVPPDYVHHILVAVMYYLANHISVEVECAVEILGKQTTLGFNTLTGEENTLSIPYTLSGYARSWKGLGSILFNKPKNGGRFACKFTPGATHPSSVGPAYIWMHMAKPLNIRVQPPNHLAMGRQGMIVLHSQSVGDLTTQGAGLVNPTKVASFTATATVGFHPLTKYPSMWGNNCNIKRSQGKCHKRMVDIETKIRYEKSFYDPYQNRSVLPDHTQSAVFLAPEKGKRDKRQVFAGIAIVTAFAVQGVVDYAGYKGIQGLEQELNDDMNTRAAANNVRFRQADTAIGNLSRQIQDLNSKVEALSEEDEATVQLLLRTVRVQALENAILQKQIGENNRALVEMSRAHLRTATADRIESDAQTFLFKTIVSALTNSKPFLQQGIGYTWQLRNGIIHLQGIEKQLIDPRDAERHTDYDAIINATCENLRADEKQSAIRELDKNLTRDVQKHLRQAQNLSRTINATRPTPIVVHYVPELTNLSIHKSGEEMRKAFLKVIKQPLKVVENVGDEVIGFAEQILGHSLKILLTLGAVIALVLILFAVIKRLRKRRLRRKEKSELKVINQVPHVND